MKPPEMPSLSDSRYQNRRERPFDQQTMEIWTKKLNVFE